MRWGEAEFKPLKDMKKQREQGIEESVKLRERIAELERSEEEHKRVEEALRASEGKYRRLFEAHDAPIVILDPEGIFLAANRVSASNFGMEGSDLVGTSIRDLFPNEADALLERHQRIIDAGEGDTFEEAFWFPDGEKWYLSKVQPARDGGGTIYGVMLISYEITERKRAEKDLQESEQRFRALFEGSPDAIFLADSESGQIIDANPAALEMLLRPYEQVVGLHHSQVHPRHRAEDSRKRFSAFARDPKRYTLFESEVLRSDGTQVPVEILARIIQIDGAPVVHVVLRDVTERKRLEAETARVERLESLGVLAGGIAHDFNNILTPILTNISMARAYGEINGEIDEMLTEAEKSTWRAKGLTQQLLTFSRGGAPVKKPTSMPRLLRDTAKFALSGSNVKGEYSMGEELWPCEIDEGQVGQVVHNMVINADQAMPEGGTIEIRAENVMVDRTHDLPLKDGKYVKISIGDQGIGILGRHLPKIFDPFYTTKEKGSGLGLSTSFAIVKRHDGIIQVESELGVGTTFHVYLPASEGDPEGGETERERPLRGKGKILVVDDDEFVRRSVGKVLKRLGYRVEVAREGAEGVGIYQKAMKGKRPFDAVIMDLTIPGGMGGKEGIRELKRIDPDARVIVSSGYSGDPVMSEFREYGFVAVVRKPYNIEVLGKVLNEVVLAEGQG
jgi:PAS domain S-box-containing protein